MADETRKPPIPSRPTSMPPEVPVDLDSSWDDDTVPRFELDDPMSESAFDRVTAVPELPAEAFAKQLMSGQQADTAPPGALPPESESRGLPRLASEPPVVSVRPLNPMEMQEAPRPARAASVADLALELEDEPYAGTSPTSVTARPGKRGDAPPELDSTAFELDMEQAPPTARAPFTSQLGRDPRDPLLELDLGDVARSGPPPAVLVPSPPSSRREQGIGEMKDRYAMGDFSGALLVAEGLLEDNADDIDAQRYAQSCRDVLTQMYSARLGTLTQRVRVAVPSDQIRWLSLDHRSGFVLSLIDGSSTVEELLDISGMNRLDALRILYTLYDQRVIALG
ncbi:MAG: hypothetical protein EOO73_29775 [Myxococcales bacterium]|nr:MAG: hypothetical protein EOO73_29775 [Myxococcales bacterium]